MNYKVKVSLRVKRDLASWGLHRSLLIQVYTRLFVDLAADPDAHLGELIVPLMARVYRVTVADPGEPTRRHEFSFAVERDDAKRELRVIGCRYDAGGGTRN